MPFTTVDEGAFPVPVLAQVEPEIFEICVPFKYRRRQDEPWLTVPKSKHFQRTDLASVPGFLLWLVPRYGAHTLAALVHDQLVKDPPEGGRIQADTIFRDALGELRVPLVRRWMMWAAVSAGTMAKSLIGKIRLVVWGLIVAIAATTFWQHVFASFTELDPWSSWLVFGHGPVADLAVVAAAAIVFVPRIGLGLLAGGSVLLYFVPTVAVLAGILVGLSLEVLARGFLAVYNRVFARMMKTGPLANVPAIISMSDELPAAGVERGCPELAVK